MSNFQKVLEVPSNGYFGGPKEVTMRGITTNEEKMIYTATDFSFIKQLVKSCCIEPKNLDVDKLHPNDIVYLVFALREMTFGATYPQSVECKNCGFRQDVDIDITKMEYNILDLDTLDEKLEVTLPASGDKVKLKLVSQGEIDAIEKEVKREADRGKLKDPEGWLFLKKFANVLDTVNGESFETETDKINYVRNMSMRDSNKINKAMSEIKFGIDQRLYFECQHCHEEMEVTGYMAPEFFHPDE